MAEFIIKMPDVGEGVAEAELVEWHVKPGDPVREDMVLAAVMTDKATVEIPSPVNGIVRWLGAEVGDTVAVKAPLLRIEVAGDGNGDGDAADGGTDASPLAGVEASAIGTVENQPDAVVKAPLVPSAAKNQRRTVPDETHPAPAKPVASPAVRLRAQEGGIDLRQVSGTGPAGRITHDDLDRFVARGADLPVSAKALARNTTFEEIKMTGLRRRISEKMTRAATRIPHITYVEEIDVTDLELLRETMNSNRKQDQPKLTLLPFLMRAMVKACAEQPGINATFDDDAGIITRHGGVHIGVATQTSAGLTVPVVRHAEARSIWDCATELMRVAEAARSGSALREELSGSTITITSLGALGGIATTPIINHPEVAIVGVNKIVMRPVWDGRQFIARKMMNLSSSFDHRVVDGFDAASFIQRIKTLLETPALLFIEG
ncbi:catalytic domain-containing protein of component of various dehydrogenase complexes [Rhizobium sp. PDO1-076]|uniref:dihydrolipoamide acetyltransferase family protein n=3 Tax=Rhizobium TaxID=379 RepID=UPI00024E31DE|nr:dihydrolipoamide acetyltransferase family protein [Rhizobium sp. PDO1-076]EHS54086.1 catalytic domain-containing protein of component of various dehydrogenase complexes [Rhizobium sp. PDO1-076]